MFGGIFPATIFPIEIFPNVIFPKTYITEVKRMTNFKKAFYGLNKTDSTELNTIINNADTLNNNLESSKITRSATIIIAASDSPAKSKAQADYICDGTADEVEIATAATALGSIGGKIALMEGNFNITAADVVLPSNTILEGVGAGTIVNLITKRININSDRTNIIIRNMTFDASRLGARNGLPITTNSNNITIENLFVRNHATPEQFFVASGCSNVTFNNINFSSYVSGFVLGAASNLTRITNCTSSYDTSTSFITADGTSNAYISNNSVKSPLLRLSNSGGRSGTNIHVTNNFINGYHDYYAILITNGESGVANNNVTVVGNIIVAGSTTEPFNAIGIYGRTSGFVVANNNIDQTLNGHNAIGVSNSSDGVVIGNRVSGCTEAGEGGIEIEANPVHGGIPGHSERVLVTGNYVHDSKWGIYTRTMDPNNSSWEGSPQIPSDVLIDSNYIYNCEVGIELMNGDHVTAQNNRLHSNTTEVSVAEGVTNYTFYNNDGYATENSGTETIAASETSVVVTHNLAVAPTNVVVTPTGNVGACWVDTITTTQFTIHCATASETNTPIYWSAVV